MTLWEHHQIKAQAKKDAAHIMNILELEGHLPEDPIVRAVFKELLQLVSEPANKQFKHQVIRTILEYKMAKPSAKQDITIRSAEDWLKDLADQEDNAPPSD